jgi:tRNA dimethylallyltransferase
LNKSPDKTVIIVTGPTASGKTTEAIRLAKEYKTEIISADSRQCYKELSIGVARPSPEELAAVPHHFIASHSIESEVNAAGFEVYALEKAAEIFSKHDQVIMVGGTGLYIKAFTDGLDAIPDIEAGIREEVRNTYITNGMEWLTEEVRMKDPLFFEQGEIQNPQRMMRALEVIKSTGTSILSYQSGKTEGRNFNIKKIGLDIPREQLIENINRRVDQMIERGLLEEARSLLPKRNLNALQTVGYRELFEYFDGDLTLAQAVERIKINTRQYAKRQLTWFKRDPQINWVSPGTPIG